jgi:hypothetical protein
MFLEIIVALIVSLIIVWLFYKYILWSIEYKQDASLDNIKKNGYLYYLIPPTALQDSYKVVNFWANYYYILVPICVKHKSFCCISNIFPTCE